MAAKDSFTVQAAVKLLFVKLGWATWTYNLLGPVLAFFLGELLDLGILKVDLTLNSLKEADKFAEYRDAAKVAHDKAVKKVHTEEEKRAIRDEYLVLLGNIARFGNGVRPSKTKSKHP